MPTSIVRWCSVHQQYVFVQLHLNNGKCSLHIIIDQIVSLRAVNASAFIILKAVWTFRLLPADKKSGRMQVLFFRDYSSIFQLM